MSNYPFSFPLLCKYLSSDFIFMQYRIASINFPFFFFFFFFFCDNRVIKKDGLNFVSLYIKHEHGPPR
jgi:hypothetical protein